MKKPTSGDKAIATKRALGGQPELERQGKMAAHTKKYPRADYPDMLNPFAEESFPPAEKARRAAFWLWCRKSPDRDHSENPHRWQGE